MSPMDVTRPSTAARPCAKSSLSTHKTVPHALTRASTVLNSLFVRLRGWSGSDLGNGDLPHSWPPWEVSVDGSCGEPTTDYKRAFYLSLSSEWWISDKSSPKTRKRQSICTPNMRSLYQNDRRCSISIYIATNSALRALVSTLACFLDTKQLVFK